MKKITLLLLFIWSLTGRAQLSLEGFETPWGTTGPPGWTIVNAQGANIAWSQSELDNTFQPPYQGNHAAYLQRENVQSSAPLPEDWLISPYFTLPTNGELTFFSRLTFPDDQGGIYKVMISTNPDPSLLSAYQQLQLWSETAINPVQTVYTKIIVPIPQTYTGQVHIAFVMLGDNADRWLIDNVKVTAVCATPTALTATNISITSASLGWENPSNSTSWEIEVVEELDIPTGTGVTYTGSLPYPALSLVPKTCYKYYVRSLCSDGGQSFWAGPFFFCTQGIGDSCQNPIVINTLPYTTNDTTANYANLLNGEPGLQCNTLEFENYLGGNDVVYSFTSPTDIIIAIDMACNESFSGIFVYDECTNIGVDCLAGTPAGPANPAHIQDFPITANQDYLIVISSQEFVPSTAYTLTIQQIFCQAPENLSVSGVNQGSAKLSWDANSATSWQVALQIAGTGLPAGPGITVTDNTAFTISQTISGQPLIEATSYEYYVRASCNNGNFSPWSGPYSFTTTHMPAALNYFEDFEVFPDWILSNGAENNKWTIGTAASNGGNAGLYITDNGGLNNTYNNEIPSLVHAYRDIQMPGVVDQLSLSFDWKSQGEGGFDILRVWLVPASFTPTPGLEVFEETGFIQLAGSLCMNNQWSAAAQQVDVSAYAGEVLRLIFEWRNDGVSGESPAAAIDDIAISLVSCPKPNTLLLEGTTTTSATISWSSPTTVTPTFDYYMATNALPPTALTPATGNINATGILLENLEASGNYYFWVRSNCGNNEFSLWIGPLAFNTPQIPATLNYEQDFETVNGWTLSNGNQGNQWVVGTAVSNTSDHSLYISDDGGITNNYVTNNFSIVYAYRDIEMPADLELLQLSFDWKNKGEGSFDVINVWLAPLSFSPVPGQIIEPQLDVQQIATSLAQDDPISWQNFNTVIEASAYAETTARLIFEWRNDGGGGSNPPAAIDNINLTKITCAAPTALALTSLTENVVAISWAEPDIIPQGYEYIVVSDQSAPDNNATPTGSTAVTALSLNNLPPDTAFYFWVRSTCGGNDKSLWSGPIAVVTPQVPATLPYQEDFEPDNNWTLRDGTQPNKWVVGTAVSNTPTHSLYISNSNGITNQYVQTMPSHVYAYRDITIPAGTNEIEMSFDWKNSGEIFADMINFWKVPTTFVPVPGQDIFESDENIFIGGNLTTAPDWTNAYYTMPANGFSDITYRFVFEWRNDSSGGTNPPAAIDNIIINKLTCPRPSDLIVTEIGQQQATLGWTETGDAEQWEIYVVEADQPAPTPSSSGTSVSSDEIIYTEGLVTATAYIVYVRSVCGADDKSRWVGPVPFMTTATNDECEDAIPLTVNPALDCIINTNSTFTGATVSIQPSQCAGTNSGDIWFTFTAASTSHTIALSDFSGAPDPVILGLYEGNDCGNLTELKCSTNNVIIATQLVIGTTYMVRAYINKPDSDLSTSFAICVNTPPPPSNINQTDCLVTTINPDFEQPDNPASIFPSMLNHNTVPGWRTTALDEIMEFWPVPNFEDVPSFSGVQFIELNANLVSGIFQDYATPQSTEFTYGFAHRGRLGTDTCKLLAGPPEGPFEEITTATTANTAWEHYTGSYTSPAGQPVTRFIFQSVTSVGGQSIGNFLDAIEFTANNGVISVTPATLDCLNKTSSVIAAGSGQWVANESNPAVTVIEDPFDNHTTISGFTLSGTYKYQWVTQFCTSTIEITYSQGDVPMPQAETLYNYCQDQVATALTATALEGYSLNWYADLQGETALLAAPLPLTDVAGVFHYYVSQTSPSGCESERLEISSIVTKSVVATVSFDYQAVYCFTDSAPFPLLAEGFTHGGSFSSGEGLVIDPATGTINIPLSKPGSYIVTYTIAADPASCTMEGTFSDNITLYPEISLILDGKCDNNDFLINATAQDGIFPETTLFKWTAAGETVDGQSDAVFNVTDYLQNAKGETTFPLIFELTVDINGCQASGSIAIDGITCTIQRGISPNGDGMNDNFDLTGFDVDKLTIFNRYGKEVYVQHKYSDQWYGQGNNGNELPTGTYFYSIGEASGNTFTGWIYINREE